ncbi:MAG: nucleotidyl transferase AbiEii/AbiGii toxin family protein [Acidobacteria bacterium]|nr:nucleotidyl transferase AbiEii/AbiGii toxin family protein [Acidobacteriota bacterium]
MRLAFLELPAGERRVYIDEAAARRGLSAVIVEKDFWVCWLLSVLFESSFRDAIVFKGGTSLSKVFGVINRFSEDIDLSLTPAFLGLDEPDATAGLSKGQASKWMERAEAKCTTVVRDTLTPEIAAELEVQLGEGASPWLAFEVDAHSHSPVLLFHYPTTQPPALDYLTRSVKLEFGSLTEQRPTGSHAVRPWIADVLPDAFADWQCDVVALDLHRSFWEKATILHAEHHRPSEKVTPDRFARHYADTAALALHADAAGAIAQSDLCERVVRWKSRFFGSAWARYDLAGPPTFRLVPPPEREAALRRDYQAMRDMYLSEPESFERILTTLGDVERRINRLEGRV